MINNTLKLEKVTVIEGKGMVVKVYVRKENMEEKLIVCVETEDEQRTIELLRTEALEDSGRAYLKKLGNFEGLLASKDIIQKVALYVRKNWSNLPRRVIKGNSKTEEIYSKLFEYAENSLDKERARIENERCYIRAPFFDEIMSELNLRYDRKELFKELKDAKVLDYNGSRNDKTVRLSGMNEQQKFICLLPIKAVEKNMQECKNAETEATEAEIEGNEYPTSEMAEKITAFPYPGAKNGSEINNGICSMLPLEIMNIKEPYCGSGAIALNVSNVRGKICLNDKDKAIANLWSVLVNEEEADLLLDKLKNTGYSKDDFEEALKIHEQMYDYGRVDRAWSELVLTYCSFNCLRKNYRKMNSNERNKMQKRIVRNIRRTIERLGKQEVEVTNTDALEIIANSTAEDTLYIDPPYDAQQLSSNNLYRHSYDRDDQMDLLKLLQEKGNSENPPKMIVSGYGKEDISQDFYSTHLSGNWKRYKLGNFHKPTSNKTGKSSRGIEYAWCNYEPDETALQFVELADERKGGVCNE